MMEQKTRKTKNTKDYLLQKKKKKREILLNNQIYKCQNCLLNKYGYT